MQRQRQRSFATLAFEMKRKCVVEASLSLSLITNSGASATWLSCQAKSRLRVFRGVIYKLQPGVDERATLPFLNLKSFGVPHFL